MSNRSKLQFPNRKQYLITIPKSLVLAKSWRKSDVLEFNFDASANIIVQKQGDSGAPASKSILQFRNEKQFVITLPKSMVMAKGWKQGDELEFVLNEQANIVIRKHE